MLKTILVASFLGAAFGGGLRDNNGIVASYVQSLDSSSPSNKWSVSNGTITFPGNVPGDLITDLELGGVIGDPLYMLNFKVPVWDWGNFTYTLAFTPDTSLVSGGDQVLVFEGIKMVADIALNGQPLFYASDQFLRYDVPVTGILKAGQVNTLTVTFPQYSDDRNSEERWMSCSGGWDWAPYSDTSYKGCTTFSKGIWKSVSLVGIAPASAAITHVSPRVYYNGTYPTAPLSDTAHGDFTVNVAVHFQVPSTATGPVAGSLEVVGGWAGGKVTTPVSLPPGNSSTTIVLTAVNNAVSLWWPAQTPGAQTRYPINVTFTPSAPGSGPPVSDSRMIGFRVFTLVTGNDTDPSTLIGRDGQDHFTMRFKVNGANIYSRGANMIPMEEMEGRSSVEAHRRLVQSAVEGGFNTFRLWGGGIFQYDAWYDACDEFGMLIYHDMMFAQGQHSPSVTTTQTAEILYQLRRLSSHPSLSLFDGCNECSGHGIYASFVMTQVAEEDPSRPPWPSCPAQGWTSGVDALWGLPNGSPLGLTPRLAQNKSESDALQLSSRFPIVRGTCAVQSNHAAATLLGCGEGGANACTFIPNNDYDTGTIGPNANSPTPADCCSQCSARPDCEAATWVPNTCWFKNKTQAGLPVWKNGAVGCWPAGHTPPPPPPPPAPGCDNLPYETHGYYQHGEGYKTVNSGAALSPFDPNQPPSMPNPSLTGPACPGTYASEFGAVAYSSWESFASTLAPTSYGLHNAAMAQRNYAADSFITSFANTPWPSGFDGQNGVAYLQKQLYWQMLAQALWVKSDIEGRRGQNAWGTVTWQFNEIWPTGGWGSIEYGTVGFTPGQVEGGRWKPLQYFLRRFLYKNALVAASKDGRLLVKNDDSHAPLVGSARVSLIHLADGSVTPLGSPMPVSLGIGAGVSAWGCVGQGAGANPYACTPWATLLPTAGCASSGADCIAWLEVLGQDGTTVIVDNFELLTAPYLLDFPPSPKVAAAVATTPNGDGSLDITLTTDAVALFVVLTTAAEGRFSDNAFILTPPSTTIQFIPWKPLNATLLANTLRVEHVAKWGVNATRA